MHVQLAITGGGTGGHVYPALAVIRRLFQSPFARASSASNPPREEPKPAGQSIASPGRPALEEAIYIGSSWGVERKLVPPETVRRFLFPMAAPTSVRGLILLGLATVRSFAVLIRTRPRVTFATGGYVSAPATVASWLLRIPVILFLPDVLPGRAMRRLAPMARRIAVSVDTAADRFPAGKAVVTGYPVRDSFLNVSRSDARRHFGIPEEALALVVFGGSLGARSINTALLRILPHVLKSAYVIHVSGEARLAEVEGRVQGVPDELHRRYLLFPYLDEHEMAKALAAADLALCRSGASVLAELPITGTPAILVPLPETKVNQRANAEFLATHGAAVILEDSGLENELPASLLGLLSERAKLAAMTTSAKQLARPNAAEDIVALIKQVAA